MNGIEKITQRIASEANAQCLDISSQAAQRCNDIRRDYETQAKAVYESALSAGKLEIEQIRQRADRTVRLDIKKDVLSLKQELMGVAFTMAREKLLALPRDEYVAFLARLAADAAQGDEQLILSARDTAAIGEAVTAAANAELARRGKKAALTLDRAGRDIAGGLVLRQGDVEANCTIDTLLALSRDTLAGQVAEILFA